MKALQLLQGTTDLLPMDYNGSLEAKQKFVQGYIESVNLFRSGQHRTVLAWVNEEGSFREDLKPTLIYARNGMVHNIIKGNVMFEAVDETTGNSVELTDKEIEFLKTNLISSILPTQIGTLNLLTADIMFIGNEAMRVF